LRQGGELTKSQALEAKGYIERLTSSRRGNLTIPPTTADWLRGLDDDQYARLVKAGLCDPRPTAEPAPEPDVPTLAVFLDSYIAKRADVKGGTSVVYGHTRRCLVEFFGAGKPLAEITPADADDWRRWLGLAKNEDDPKAGGQGLSDNTVRRRCGIARQFFRDAVRRRLIAESPFADMQGVVVRSNRSRDYFVTREEADSVLKACPDKQWQLLFALSRYGSLRCPSEHLTLRWGDVDFDAGRITVRSPKTEHHEGKGIRVMPLFPELRPYLEAVRDEFLDDFDPKEKRLSEQPVIARYRESNINLRTQLCKIISRAKLKPWPKLFQNLRATRATELADQFPTHVAAGWLGHSTTIADKHYRQTTAEHFAKALQNAQHAAQQQSTETGEADGNERKVESENSLGVRKTRVLPMAGVGDTGFEPVTSAV
jgi:integrase